MAATTLDLSRGSQFFVRFPKSHGNTVYLYDKNRSVYVPFTSSKAFQSFTGGTSPDEAYQGGMIYDLAEPLPGVFVPDQDGIYDDGHVPANSTFWSQGSHTGKGGGHDGQGGPSFAGFVKTSGSPTVYGITPSGQYIAFESADQFLQAGGDWNKIVTVANVPESMPFSQFNAMNSQPSNQEQPTFGGSAQTGNLSSAYGATKNTEMEKQAADMLGILFTTLKNQGAISQQTFSNYISNPINLAKYVNAWAYGGYTGDDIFRDIKAKETGINASGISTTQKAADFYKTQEYAAAHNNTMLNAPLNLSIDPGVMNNPIFAIPGDAFKTLIPVVDKTSPQFKEEAKKIQDTYHDLLLQQLEAKTGQQKAVADDNYRVFKDQLDKKYGIALSDDAVSAWSQVQQLTSGAVQGNMLNSGVYNEALDKVLSTRRIQDQRMRDQKVTESDAARRDYYLNQATPAQIANDLTPEERQRWGLTASPDVLNWVNSLKTNYPTLSDDEISQLKSTLVDENGNMRSSLYRSLFENKYGLNKEKSLYQENTLLNQKVDATEKAYAPYTKSDNPFLQYQGSDPNANNVAQTTTDTVQQPTPTPSAGLQMPAGYPASNATSTQQPSQGLQMPAQYQAPQNSQRDLSNDYALNGSTVYNLKTGYGYSNQNDFFKDAGVDSFNNVKFKTDYTPSFYKYNDNPTVYNAYNNQALDYNSYLKSGGKSDFSNVITKKR